MLAGRLAAVLVVLLAVVASAACAGVGGTLQTADLLLDGEPFSPEVALTPSQRARGLMNRERAPDDGMLFVYTSARRPGFWMKNTLVPLRVVFFDRSGQRVDEQQMTPCTEDPCRVYLSKKPFLYALELPAGDTRPAEKIGPQEELQRLWERAS